MAIIQPPGITRGALGAATFTATGATTARSMADRAAESMTFADFGCQLSGTVDDTANAQVALNWLGAASFRRLILPFGKGMRIDSALTLDCKGNVNLCLDLLGPLFPASGIGAVLTIFNTETSAFHLNVESGGGALVDYTQADPVGAQEAFVIRGVRSSNVSVRARGFGGRALRTKVQLTGEQKTSANTYQVICEDGAAGVKVAQAYYLQGSTFFGNISKVTQPSFDYASIVDSCIDVTLGHIEGPNLEFRDSGSMWGDTLALGDGSGVGTNLKLLRCGRVTIDKVLCAGPGIGVHVKDALATGGRIEIKSIQSVNSTDTDLLIENSPAVKAGLSSALGKVPLKLTGASTKDVDVDLSVLNCSQQVVIKDAGISNVTIKGFVRGAATDGTTACFSLRGGDLGVSIERLKFTSTTGTAVFDLDSNNEIFVDGGRYSYSGVAAFATNAPIARNVQGYKTEASGSASIAQNGTSITVSHGLVTTPDNVVIAARSVTDGKDIGVSAFTSTTFGINIPTAAAAAFTLYWRASVGRTMP